MTKFLKTWTPRDVAEADDKPLAFANYVQQTLGVPWPTLNDQKVLRKRIKDFLGATPEADYYTLCRAVQWARARKRRPPRVWMVVDLVRDAWAAGALPELDPANRTDKAVEKAIAEALKVETHDGWRRRLLGARGSDAREAALESWRKARRHG